MVISSIVLASGLFIVGFFKLNEANRRTNNVLPYSKTARFA